MSFEEEGRDMNYYYQGTFLYLKVKCKNEQNVSFFVWKKVFPATIFKQAHQ